MPRARLALEREHVQHPARAAADVEHGAVGRGGDRLVDRAGRARASARGPGGCAGRRARGAGGRRGRRRGRRRRARRDSCDQGGGEPRVGGLGRDGAGVGDRCPRRAGRGAGSGRSRARAAAPAAVRPCRPRSSGSRRRRGLTRFSRGRARPHQPPSAARPSAQDSARPASSSAGVSCGVSMPTRKAAVARVLERGREPLTEAVAPLGDDLEAVRQPVAGLAVEGEDAPVGAAGGDRGERVDERRLGKGRGLLRGEGRGQARLGASGDGGLRDDDDGAHRRPPARRACPGRHAAFPRTVPVTFEVPTRGR